MENGNQDQNENQQQQQNEHQQQPLDLQMAIHPNHQNGQTPLNLDTAGIIQCPRPIGTSLQPHLPIPTFMCAATRPLEKQEMKPNSLISWTTANKMAIVYQIEANKPFILQCGAHLNSRVAFSSRNRRNKFDVYIPTGLPITCSFFDPMRLDFNSIRPMASSTASTTSSNQNTTESNTNTSSNANASSASLNTINNDDDESFTLYGYHWAFDKLTDLPNIPQCCVPVGRNFIIVDHVTVWPMYQANFATTVINGF